MLAAIVFAEPLVHLLAGAFTEVPGKFELTVLLTRIVAPFLLLVASGRRVHGDAQLAQRVLRPGAVAGDVRRRLESPPPSLWRRCFGGRGQNRWWRWRSACWPAASARCCCSGRPWRPTASATGPRSISIPGWRDPDADGSGTVGLAATQVNVFVNTVVATGEGTGAVSYLGYAFRLMYLPIGLFGVSIATATTPAMSRLAATADAPRMRSTLAAAVALMLTLNVPATFGLIVLAEPIVRVIFERGSFTATDTVATAAAVQLYALGLVGYSVVKIVSPTFYAIGRSRTPVAVGVAALERLVPSVSLASAGAALRLPRAGAQRVDRRNSQRRRAGMAGRAPWRPRSAAPGVVVTGTKMLAASGLMAAAGWWALRGLELAVPGTALPWQVARLAGAITASLALAAAAHLLRVREFEE